MNQVQNLLFQNHRSSLAYPPRQVTLEPRQGYEDLYVNPRRKSMTNNRYENLPKSVDLKQNKAKKQLELPQLQKKTKLLSKLTKVQEFIRQKYSKNHIPQHQQELQLPKLINGSLSRGTTTTANQTHQTKSNHSPLTQKQIQRLKLKQQQKKQKKQRFKQISGLAQKITSSILKLINNYYDQLLFQPFEQLRQIVNTKISDYKYNFIPDVVQNLVQISQKLKQSSVRNDILKFLTLITLEGAFLPHDFFTLFQIRRLDFQKDKFKLKRITEQQIKMIVGIFLGIKVFCYHIFAKPWNVQILQFTEKIDKSSYAIFKSYISYFSTAFSNFYKGIPIHKQDHIYQLIENGVRPMRMPKQDETFFIQVQVKYEKEHRLILSNLLTWVNRISMQVIKNRQKIKDQEDKQ